jgi:hypothetical protein
MLTYKTNISYKISMYVYNIGYIPEILRTPNTSGSLLIEFAPKGRRRFRAATMLLFSIYNKNYLHKSAYFSKTYYHKQFLYPWSGGASVTATSEVRWPLVGRTIIDDKELNV